MGLFTPNYVKPGPGIDKDAPPKTGLALFFEIFIREFWALVKLNVLFLLTCIPIVTIGAAMGAMTKVTVRMVRDIPNDVWYDYWRGFRENWKASTVLGLITALVYGGGLLGLVLYPAGSAIWRKPRISSWPKWWGSVYSIFAMRTHSFRSPPGRRSL